MSFAAVSEYLRGQMAQVEGWCSPFLWNAIEPLAIEMSKDGDPAPVAEIGVHHGKFFIGLVKTMNSNRKHYAFDIFDLQQFNLDRSGLGNLQTFQDNLKKAGISAETVEIVKVDSMTIDATMIADIRAKTGGFSFFSVDGSHMVEHTINDIQVAMQLTSPKGIIFVDDYSNQSWPGVHEGVAKLYFTSAPRFVPLVFLEGKLLLCHISYHLQYLKLLALHFREHYPDCRLKHVQRFGYTTITVASQPKVKKFLST